MSTMDIRPTAAEAARDDAPDDTWVIEEADPEVGIFGDSIVHDCAANREDCDEAAIDTTFRDEATIVVCTTTFTCRACGATTSFDESWPRDMFTEPGRE